MQFSISTGYGLLAVDYLAKNQDKIIATQEIAKKYSISPNFLQKIMQQLLEAHILKSIQEPTVGFCLAKSPEQISMLELIEALEGPISSEPYTNGIANNNMIEEIYEKGLAEIKSVLEKTKLSDML